MKLEEIEERVLLDALYWGIQHSIDTRHWEEKLIPNINKRLSETEAFENLIKILVKEFEIEESKMTSVLMKTSYVKEHFNGLKGVIEYMEKKTGSSPKKHT